MSETEPIPWLGVSREGGAVSRLVNDGVARRRQAISSRNPSQRARIDDAEEVEAIQNVHALSIVSFGNRADCVLSFAVQLPLLFRCSSSVTESSRMREFQLLSKPA
jgi:hypothetical protein